MAGPTRKFDTVMYSERRVSPAITDGAAGLAVPLLAITGPAKIRCW